MKKVVVRIAEGLGNQLFMYANAYTLSKKINYTLFTDSTSGYFKKKNQTRAYELSKLNISASEIDNSYKYDNYLLDIKRKFYKKLDSFFYKKNFLIENIDHNKITEYNNYSNNNFSNLLRIEGYYQSEKYFCDYKNELISEFQIQNNFINIDHPIINSLKKENSVSLSIRQNRYSEGKIINKDKSRLFIKDTINYIKKSVSFFKKKLDSPKFYLWADDFSNLSEYFDKNEFSFIINPNNKILNDFNLFKYSKHFIVGPTSFHWWGAWLNKNPNKICLRPSNINPSNNKDYWPEDWISL